MSTVIDAKNLQWTAISNSMSEKLRITEFKGVCHRCKAERVGLHTLSLGMDRPTYCLDCVQQALRALEIADQGDEDA